MKDLHSIQNYLELKLHASRADGNMDFDVEKATALRDKWLKTEKTKRRKSIIWEKLLEFPRTTTLHGLRYITEKDLHPVEKLFWILTFTVSLLYCFCLVQRVWTKWQTSPVIVTLSEKFVPVNEVPFPAITICPQRKNSQFDYDHYTTQNTVLDRFTNVSQKTYETFQDMALVCSVDNKYKEIIRRFQRSYSNSSSVETILEYGLSIDKCFTECKWRGEKLNCSELFQRVLTSQGVCYTMNTLASDEIFRTENLHNEFKYLETTNKSRNWIKDFGYTDDDDLNVYPRRGRENGAEPDLIITLKENKTEKDRLCNSLGEGFKVYISDPADLPQGFLHYYSVLPDHKTSVALKYNILKTEKTLSDRIEVKQRQCFFPHERELRYFGSYSPRNCQMECLTNYTFEKCNCVAFYMPHYNSSRICTIESLPCLNKAKEELAMARINYSMSTIQQCSCLPSCNMVDYDAETMLSRYQVEEFKEKSRPVLFYLPRLTIDKIEKFSLVNISYSSLEIFYKSPQYMSFKRSEIFGTTDFLANCGGLLGLFLGFSVLSLIEMVYFVTLRLWCALARGTRTHDLQS